MKFLQDAEAESLSKDNFLNNLEPILIWLFVKLLESRHYFAIVTSSVIVRKRILIALWRSSRDRSKGLARAWESRYSKTRSLSSFLLT